MIIAKSLYNETLIKPVEEGADTLLLVSGYASATMAVHHLLDIKGILRKKVNIHLIIGMCRGQGIAFSNHIAFQTIMDKDYIGAFKCSYVYKNSPVHSKAYIWLKDGKFFKAFIGSANYTQTAFFNKNREILTQYQKPDILDYYNDIEKDSIYCDDIDVAEYISILNERQYYEHLRQKSNNELGTNEILKNKDLETVKVSLLTRNKNPGNPGGALNWGHRSYRDRNEAYIPLRAEVAKTDFFPKKKIQFTLFTDDSKVLICTRAQGTDNGKAIHTPQDNSLLGIYFRNRLGLESGEFITTKHLENYGRTDVSFEKIDDETYFMDFSV